MKKLYSMFAFVTMVTGCAALPSQEEIRDADYGSYPDNHESIVKGFYALGLKDPESVRYGSITRPQPYVLASRIDAAIYGHLVCVTYNAKNSYGAYTGFSTDALILRNGYVEKHLKDSMWYANRICQ